MYSKGLYEKVTFNRIVNSSILLGLIVLLSVTASVSLSNLYSVRIQQITFVSYGAIVIGGLLVSRLSVEKKVVLDVTILDALLFIFILYIGCDRYFGHTTSGFSLRFIEIVVLSMVYLFLRFKVKYYPYFLFACLFGCTVQSLYGLSQLYGFYPSNNENFPITGNFFNPGPLAGYVLFGLSTSIGLYLFKYPIDNKINFKFSILSKKTIDVMFSCFLISGMICCILVLFACKSRASWFGLVLCCALLVYKYRYENLWKQFNPKSKIYIFILAGVALLVIIVSLYFINQNSSVGRLIIWKITAEILFKNPVLGLGFDNFSSNYMSYQARYFELNPLSDFKLVVGDIKYPFNIFITYLSENGIIGLFFFIVILGRTFLIKETDSMTIISKAVLLGQLIFAFFSYSEQILPIKLNVTCALAFLASKDDKLFSYAIKKIKYSLLLLYLTCSIFFLFYINKMVRSYKNWEIGTQIYSSGQYLEAIPFFSSAYPFLKREGEFLMQYGNALLKANKFGPALKVFYNAEEYFNNYPLQIAIGNCYKNLKKPNLAMASYRKASNMVPSRLYPKYLQVIYFLELNKKKTAVKLAKIILKMQVKINSSATKEIKDKMHKIIANQNLSSDEILSIVNITSEMSADSI